MELTFGGRLRQQRERQQISLSAIAADTKIKVSLLEALERDDLSHWPQRIYRRAYIRSYARAIGLDPETVVREFIELYPDPVEPNPNEPGAGAETGAAAPQPSGTIFRRLVTSAIGAVPAFLQRSDRVDTASGQAAVPSNRSPFEAARHGVVPDTAFGAAPDRVAGDKPDAAPAHEDVATSDAAGAGERDLDLRFPASLLDDAEAASARTEQDGIDDTVAAPVVSEMNDSASAHRLAPAFDLPALADLCTRLGRVLERRELVPLLDEAAHLFDAVGLTVWSWDAQANVLRASVAYGYPDLALAQWPGVPLDADNGIAAAFRSASRCVVDGGGSRTGAVVVPLLGPLECAGVLAVELRHGGERQDAIQAAATILAAQLVTLLGPAAPVAEAVNL